MDLLRATIKTLFFDYPLESLASYIMKGGGEAELFERCAEILKWRERAYTETETKILQNILSDEWLVDDNIPFDNATSYEKVFLCLQKCGFKLINPHLREPVVRFDQLLRWRDLTLCVGEDLLVIPTIAYEDYKHSPERNMLWNPVLGHDNKKINEILRSTLCETHSHLYASADIFSLNWIAVMNHPGVVKDRENDSERIKSFLLRRRQEYDPVNPHSELNLSLKEWIAVAADIRIKLYKLLNGKIEDPELDLALKFIIESDQQDIIAKINDIESKISEFNVTALPLGSSDFILDYAIQKGNTWGCDLKSPFMIYFGERMLLYKFFTSYYNGYELIRRFAPQVYLYLLIKNKVRREFVHTNGLSGLLNFKEYQDFKGFFTGRSEDNLQRELKKVWLRYAVQSSLGTDYRHTLETRISPEVIRDISNIDFWKAIFTEEDVLSDESKSNVTFVVHFHKGYDNVVENRQDGQLRHKKLRKELDGQKDNVFNSIIDKVAGGHNFVGIDVAGNELATPPEVYAPVFREAERLGINNVTYHVGEDFYDVVFGLRMIDDAVDFLRLGSGTRLGHAIALGIDVRKYYSRRHRTIIIPRQDLLDNVVWMKYTALEANIQLQPKTQLFIEEKFASLYHKIGYIQNASTYEYREAMKKRGDVSLKGDWDKEENNPADKILKEYLYSKKVFVEGGRTTTCKLEEETVEDISKLQEYIMKKIDRLGLTIETNPSSNMSVGAFSQYSELPLFKFHSVGDSEGSKMAVTVNTDDKGVFATSLENEYSLIAIALRKQNDKNGNPKWNDKDIENYLKQLAYYANMSRFR